MNFGIEIETILKKDNVSEFTDAFNKISPASHTPWSGATRKFSTWVITKDGSILDKDGKRAVLGYEICSPVLDTKKDMATLKKLCGIFTSYTSPNKTCAVHIHVGLEKYKDYDSIAKKLFYLYQKLEHKIHSMFAVSRRENDYCKSIQTLTWSAAMETLTTNKYYAIRFSSLKTIEFRIHQATTNFIKIKNWLTIIEGILELADKLTIEQIMQKSIQELWDRVIVDPAVLKYYHERVAFFGAVTKARQYNATEKQRIINECRTSNSGE